MKLSTLILSALTLGFSSCVSAQLMQPKGTFTRQDTLRGSIGPGRAWWDVQHYTVEVTPDYASKTITGRTTIRFKVLPGRKSNNMQIDLQQPLVIDSLFYDNRPYINDPGAPFYQQGNTWQVPLPRTEDGSVHTLTIAYHGRPKEAINPPWDGGWIWRKDKEGNPWMSVAVQGMGASAWYPCKDHQSDEPDQGSRLIMNIPSNLVGVGNGRLKSRESINGLTRFTWEVTSPINNYNIVPYIGKYTNWSDTLQGEKGTLSLNFWVLQQDTARARQQFQQVKPTIRAFEHWFGPYAFYEDGFQLVQSPHLGMEHQSAVAYGNEFQNGYLGRDLSGSGWGMKWDFIIVHESGHEWFGNNITTRDIADMWVHEGFTSYSETLFTEYWYGKEAGEAYLQGLRRNIANKETVIGPYGVNREGSGDMYFKGSNMLHTIRHVIGNDTLFRQILRGLNSDFYRQTVTSRQVEEYISKRSGRDLSKIFDQYLRNTNIPTLELQTTKTGIRYRWTNSIPGFNMPIRVNAGRWITLQPKEGQWQTLNATGMAPGSKVEVDKNFYVNVKG